MREGETVEITYHGETIARLVPVALPEQPEEDVAAIWTDLDRLTAEISAKWPVGISAEDVVSTGRREL